LESIIAIYLFAPDIECKKIGLEYGLLLIITSKFG